MLTISKNGLKPTKPEGCGQADNQHRVCAPQRAYRIRRGVAIGGLSVVGRILWANYLQPST